MIHSRRAFLADVGRGMLTATVGAAVAADLGLAPAWAGEEPPRLSFGDQEPLVALLQETPAAKLLPLLVEKLRGGTELSQLVSAAALANARTFGGEDYIGFHTLMALSPSLRMARELPAARQPLPVLKVLYRNTNRIQEKGGPRNEVLRPVAANTVAPTGEAGGNRLREVVRGRNMSEAEAVFAAQTRGTPREALDAVLCAVEDAVEVHRVVLVSRAWDLVGLVGAAQAHTLLRQSVHYCVKEENSKYTANKSGIRTLLPKLLDEHKLVGRPLGKREADDARVTELSQTIFRSSPEEAAGAAAAALAEGLAPDAVGEAISLAVNQLVLRDVGRLKQHTSPGKPEGSIHGDSIGVHACDSAHAWRNLAGAASPRHTVACLILAAYQAAFDRRERGGDFLTWQPWPTTEQLTRVTSADPAGLLREADGAIRERDQARTVAAIYRYGEMGQPERPALDLLLRFAVSEDGALHAEKYYATAADEFARTRPAFRWRQLAALARVTASAFGQPAPGYAEACGLLKV